MAIAFARISYHSRSQGHSAVAGAAYRSGEILTDTRTGEVHDFKNRSDVKYSNILLPKNADEKFQQREFLWNEVEAAEKRSNSQVAKDIVIALPRDLTLQQHIDLVHNFAHYHFVQHGVVADVAIHDHGDGNPHTHIYVTTRRLLGDRFDKYKARDLEPDVVKGRVVDPQYWGEQWRVFQNEYFKDHDIDLQVDANFIIAQRHEGRVRGKHAHYLQEENDLRKKASVEVALNEPESVLNILGSTQGVFSERDIAMLLHKNTQTPEQFTTALIQVKAHQDLILLGPGDDGRTRYTTRANYQREAKMADTALELSRVSKHGVHPKVAKTSADVFSLNAEQQEALKYLGRGGDIRAVVGRAGTGKSYMMKAANHMWERCGYSVRGVAVSGIAAKGLENDSGIASQTLASLKMQLNLGTTSLSAKTILVMDEAGMTNTHDMAFVVEAVQAAGAKLVLIGDPSQLQPIGPGAPFRAITELVGFSELSQIQRQKDKADCKASVKLSEGNVGFAIDHYAQKGQIHLVYAKPKMESNKGISHSTEADEEEGDGGESGSGAMGAIAALIQHWQRDLSAETISERLILAHRNADVDALNATARRAMAAKGLLKGKGKLVQSAKGSLKLSEGDRLLFLKNHRKLGLTNGEFATVTAIEGGKITVQLDAKAKKIISFSTTDYADFAYGYAATIHKAQGTTFDHSFVYVAGKAWDRYLAYVAMTRHRHGLHIYADTHQFKTLKQLKKVLSRSPTKDSVLDWPLSYAIRRGFNPEGLVGRFIDSLEIIKQRIHDKWLFVTNFAACKARRQYHEKIKVTSQLREWAKDVAQFVDARSALSKKAQQMKETLAPGEKFHHHPDYSA